MIYAFIYSRTLPGSVGDMARELAEQTHLHIHTLFVIVLPVLRLWVVSFLSGRGRCRGLLRYLGRRSNS